MSAKPSIFAELQRRHVYKVGAAYAVAGWLLVQVVTQVLPIFHVGDAIQQLFVLAIVAGFPVALVLAWLFDITPAGIVRTGAVPAGGDTSAATGEQRGLDRRLNYLLGALALLAAGYAGIEHVLLSGNGHRAGSADRSIAVLPLVNESGDPANEYFSDGLSEELIASLAQIGGLKVIGRSSSFRFKGSPEDSRSIAEKLGVGTLLEGTVRKQGGRVRIVAELINAVDGRELWSRTYDRELKDIFAVQAEIASAVADSLKLALLGAVASPQAGSYASNVDAHNAFLEGHFYFERRNLNDYRRAVEHYDDAIRLDPAYALAYAERSEAWTWIADQGNDGVADARAAARRDAEKAVAVDPDLAEAHAALGWVLFFTDWKFNEGLAELRHAEQLAPNNATVYELLARVLLYMGKIQEAEQLARRAIETDPLTFQPHNNLARVLFSENRYDEAEAEGRKAAELQPNAASNHRWQVYTAVFRHDAATALREAKAEPAEGYRYFELALALTAGSDRAAADAALADLIRYGKVGLAYQIAQVYAWRGETDSALEWLQRSYDQRDTGTLSMPIDPLMRGVRNDPRYKALLARLGLPPPA